MENITLGEMTSWIGFICLWIVVIWQIIDLRKRKKEGRYEIVPKDRWWQQTYIWQVFFRRSRYRPIASSFPWLIFIFPSIFMVFLYSVWLVDTAINGKAKTLEETNQISGIVTEVYNNKGKGEDYIRVKDDSGNEEIYSFPIIFMSDEEAEEFKKKIQDTKTKVDIWYQEWWSMNTYSSKRIWELKVDGEFVKLQSGNLIKEYEYERFAKLDKTNFPNLLWWLNYSIFGWVWLWFLNRKELPIHRLNKEKFYKKYNLKDK